MIIAGDFNVDFSRSTVTRDYLSMLISDLNLSAVDLDASDYI